MANVIQAINWDSLFMTDQKSGDFSLLFDEKVNITVTLVNHNLRLTLTNWEWINHATSKSGFFTQLIYSKQ